MKIIYLADDGTEFNKKEECIEYEQKTPIMFDCFFERTNAIGKAIYIYFPPRSVSTFLDNLDRIEINDESEIAGIEYEDNSEELGYIWNNDAQEYRRYEMGEIADMVKFLNKVDGVFKERKW